MPSLGVSIVLRLFAYRLSPKNCSILRHIVVVCISQHHREEVDILFYVTSDVILMNCKEREEIVDRTMAVLPLR